MRNFRLSRAHRRVIGLAVAAWLLLVVFSGVVAPRVLGSMLGYREYAALGAERSVLGGRLRGLVTAMTEVETRAETALRTLIKLHLVYGLHVPRYVAALPAGPAPPGPHDHGESIYGDTVEYGLALKSKATQELQTVATLFDAVERFETEHAGEIAAVPAACPLHGDDFVLTVTFGVRRSPFTSAMEFHPGIDLAAQVGAPVRAPADGLVVYSGRYPMSADAVWWRYGNIVMLRHGTSYVTIFGHLDEARVRIGQRVRRGDVIGTVGNSGWSTNPHLHYEVRIPGNQGWRPIDPRLYILDRHWGDEEEVLSRGRRGPAFGSYEPLPPSVR